MCVIERRITKIPNDIVEQLHEIEYQLSPDNILINSPRSLKNTYTRISLDFERQTALCDLGRT